jgi:hypothetical protein
MNRSSIILATLCCLVLLLQGASSYDITISGEPRTGFVTVSVDTESGVTYEVYTSEDGASWIPIGDRFTGSGFRMDIVRPATSASQLYKVAKPASWNDFSWNSSAWQ